MRCRRESRVQTRFVTFDSYHGQDQKKQISWGFFRQLPRLDLEPFFRWSGSCALTASLSLSSMSSFVHLMDNPSRNLSRCSFEPLWPFQQRGHRQDLNPHRVPSLLRFSSLVAFLFQLKEATPSSMMGSTRAFRRVARNFFPCSSLTESKLGEVTKSWRNREQVRVNDTWWHSAMATLPIQSYSYSRIQYWNHRLLPHMLHTTYTPFQYCTFLSLLIDPLLLLILHGTYNLSAVRWFIHPTCIASKFFPPPPARYSMTKHQ
jgi:hypothetical protein